jgi:hypothetical protein
MGSSRGMRLQGTIWATALAALLAPASVAHADGGGAPYVPEAPPAAPTVAVLSAGRAVAPAGAPRRVRRILTAANRLVDKPYRWGGGHRDFTLGLDRGYDCSGAVSYALYGGRLIPSPLASTGLARFGRRGPGRWVTVYANRGHAFLVVAGLRFDTGARGAGPTPRGSGPRWTAEMRPTRRFAVRHPAGL